jgi:membrane protein YqaA with SNARE-associated domain
MAKRLRPRHWKALLAGLLLLLVVAGFFLHAFDGWQAFIIRWLIDAGWVGFFLFAWFYNVLIVPFPFDPFLLMVPELAAPGALWLWWSAATLGMGLAAANGYALARWWLGPRLRPWLQRQAGYKRTEACLQRYGVWAVALSAVTPVPFSLVCWMAGFLRLSLPIVIFLALLTRGARNALVIWILAT